VTLSISGIFGVICLLGIPYFIKYIQDVDLILIGLMMMIISVILLDEILFTQLTETRFYCSLILMFSIGYPLGHTALIGVFSKIIKSGSQGTMMGIFASCGSLARITFPLLAGIIAEYYSINLAFSCAAILLIISWGGLFCYRKILIDHVSSS
jgi:MFS family permease